MMDFALKMDGVCAVGANDLQCKYTSSPHLHIELFNSRHTSDRLLVVAGEVRVHACGDGAIHCYVSKNDEFCI